MRSPFPTPEDTGSRTDPDARTPAEASPPQGRARRLLPFALAALLALTLLPGIAAVDALDWREARDQQVARETPLAVESLAPIYGGEVFFEKPFAGYVPELLASRTTRRIVPGSRGPLVDAAVSRAVRAALAAALAFLIAVVGTRAFGARAGWLAGCALASTVGLPLAARADGSQLLATLCAWLGIAALLEVAQDRSRAPALSLFRGWFALGAAALTGGPLPALWPLAGFALYFALARSHDGWRKLRPLPGLAIVAGLALPWYGFMFALHRGAFLARVAGFPYAAETRGAWFAAPLAAFSYPVLLGFPWSPLLAASLRDAAGRLRRARGGTRHDLRESEHAASLVLALFVAGSVPVAFYPHPPLTAALPSVPALALLCGRFLDRVLDGDVEAALLTAATRLTAPLGTLAALLLALLASRIPDAAAGMRLLATAIFVASWTPLLADLAGRRRLAAALFALPVALGAPLLATRVLPPLEPWLNTRGVAEGMEAVAPPRAPLAVLEPPPPSLRLLLPRTLVEVQAADARLAALAARDGHAYVAFRPAREHDVARSAIAPLEILLRTPAMVLARIAVAPPAVTGPIGSR